MNDDKPESSADTFQEGVTPVQTFSSPVIPVTPGMVLEPRRGRPQRGQYSQPQDRGNGAGAFSPEHEPDVNKAPEDGSEPAV